MVSENNHNPRACQQFQEVIELIGKRWTGAIIFVLCQGPLRFSEFRDAIPDMSDRLLTQRLKELEEHGLVVREVLTGRPIQVLYHLTPKGRALRPILDALGAWSAQWEGQGAG
jgi:DNA-binding HxlR family transcriptional regulator